jgi:NAD(P)-dependent dehydrogenase (short-subunit alcohol dehydrogenase family)
MRLDKACDHAAYDALAEIDGREDAYVALNGSLLIAEPLSGLLGLPPMERLAQPEDIANVVAFLVGPDAGWVDGQTLRVNGGTV